MRGQIFFYIMVSVFLVSDFVFADCTGGDGINYRTYDFGGQYVPRDAKVGSVIGTAQMTYIYRYTSSVICSAGDLWEVKSNKWPVAMGVAVPPFRPGVESASIFKTNIPGVGVVISVENNLRNYGEVIEGVSPYVPYKEVTIVKPGSDVLILGHEFRFTLIKISNEIPAGSSDVVKPTTAVYIGSGSNRFVGVYLKGTVIRSECSVAGAGKAYLEVPMGDIMRRKFNGKYTTLDSKDFSIPLTNCVAGSYPTGQGWNYYQNSSAHIKFEGVQGSSIIDSGKGILGLTQASTAKGVGIQILRKDGVTPLTLGQDVSIAQLNGTSMNIDLKARYIQTSDNPLGPEPGKANARAAFTVTYK